MSRILTTIFAFVFLPLSAVELRDDKVEWKALKSQVQSKQKELKELMQQISAQGHDVSRAVTSEVTMSEFLKASQWDYDHPKKVEKTYRSWRFEKVVKADDHLRQPFNQLKDCLAVADFAIKELRQQLAGEIHLSASPDLYSGNKTLEGPNFRLNGNIIIPVSMNFLVNNEDYRRAQGGFGGGYHHLGFLEKDGKVNRTLINQRRKRVQHDSASYYDPIVHFHGNRLRLPKWMLGNESKIQRSSDQSRTYSGGRHFFNYDVSNPSIQKWQRSLVHEMASAIGEENRGKVPVIHMIANEPNFSIRKNGWAVKSGGFTPEMVASYRQWLQKKYRQIGALNKSHGTKWSNFSEVASPFPLDAERLIGSALYYDACRWNMDRINAYFQMIYDEIKKADPSSHVNLKLLGGTLGRGYRDDGMDFEYLTKMMDITGCDTEAAPATATFLYNAPDRSAGDHWLDHYSFHWSEQTMLADYAKSLKPEAAHYNSEWHGLSTLSWRDFDMKRSYVRAGLWTLVSHGTSMVETWGWGRKASGEITGKVSMPGSVANQPIVFDEHGRVAKDFNAHAKRLSDLGNAARPIRIFYSEAAAIQDEKYGSHQQEVYESLKLLNHHIGVITESTISQLDPKKYLVVIPPTSHLPDSALHELKQFQARGGTMILVEGKQTFAQKSELGIARTNVSLEIEKRVSFSSPFQLATNLQKVIPKEFFVKSDLEFIQADENGKNALGIIAQQALDQETGETTISFVNVSQTPLSLKIRHRKNLPLNMQNLLKGKEHPGESLLSPMEILFLSVKPTSP